MAKARPVRGSPAKVNAVIKMGIPVGYFRTLKVHAHLVMFVGLHSTKMVLPLCLIKLVVVLVREPAPAWVRTMGKTLLAAMMMLS